MSPTPLHLKHNYQFQERKGKIGQKPQNEKLMQKNFEKGGACVIYRSTLGGIPVANDYRPDIYGFLLDHIEEESLSIFTSQTYCLRYLLANKCSIGKAKDLVHSFCYLLGLKLPYLVMFVLLVCDLCQTTYTL